MEPIIIKLSFEDKIKKAKITLGSFSDFKQDILRLIPQLGSLDFFVQYLEGNDIITISDDDDLETLREDPELQKRKLIVTKEILNMSKFNEELLSLEQTVMGSLKNSKEEKEKNGSENHEETTKEPEPIKKKPKLEREIFGTGLVDKEERKSHNEPIEFSYKRAEVTKDSEKLNENRVVLKKAKKIIENFKSGTIKRSKKFSSIIQSNPKILEGRPKKRLMILEAKSIIMELTAEESEEMVRLEQGRAELKDKKFQWKKETQDQKYPFIGEKCEGTSKEPFVGLVAGQAKIESKPFGDLMKEEKEYLSCVEKSMAEKAGEFLKAFKENAKKFSSTPKIRMRALEIKQKLAGLAQEEQRELRFCTRQTREKELAEGKRILSSLNFKKNELSEKEKRKLCKIIQRYPNGYSRCPFFLKLLNSFKQSQEISSPLRPLVAEFKPRDDLPSGLKEKEEVQKNRALSSCPLKQNDADFEKKFDERLSQVLPSIFKAFLEAMRGPEPKCPLVHPGISCDKCEIKPLIGARFKCLDCNFNLCSECFTAFGKLHQHDLKELKEEEEEVLSEEESKAEENEEKEEKGGQKRKGKGRKTNKKPKGETTIQKKTEVLMGMFSLDQKKTSEFVSANKKMSMQSLIQEIMDKKLIEKLQ